MKPSHISWAVSYTRKIMFILGMITIQASIAIKSFAKRKATAPFDGAISKNFFDIHFDIIVGYGTTRETANSRNEKIKFLLTPKEENISSDEFSE